MLSTDLLICGAGPAGLGAAWRLNELNLHNNCHGEWLVVDNAETPGGMAVSPEKEGFTWDLGGHVLFPHYPYFDAVLNEVVDNWVEVKPVRGAWMFNRFVPYPVQRNIRHFPAKELEQCLQGLAATTTDSSNNHNFEQHLKASFGFGLYKLFFEPLNFKMWGEHPGKMSASWTQHRSGSKSTNVPTVDLQRIKNNIANNIDDVAWDEDTRIRYPAVGGTGAVWQGVTSRLPAHRIKSNHEITGINLRKRIATLADGQTISYKHLFSSMPIDKLLSCLTDSPELSAQAHLFCPAAVDVVGIGVSGECPTQLEEICSLYFPDNDIAFWRASVMSNYSSTMAPEGSWSILCEINSGSSKPATGNPVTAVIEGLEKLGFVTASKIISRWHRHIPYGYPVPTLQRDKALIEIQQVLESNGVYSRGRFGGWKYEVCNQDHAFMQGVEVVDALFTGAAEVTYPTPHLAGQNSVKQYNPTNVNRHATLQ